MRKERALELLNIELECIQRQQCNRNCAECDLCQDAEELEEMYKWVIKRLQSKPLSSYDGCKALEDDCK